MFEKILLGGGSYRASVIMYNVKLAPLLCSSSHESSLLLFYGVCVCVFFPFILDSAGVTQEEGNTGFFIHLLSAVLA